MLWLISVYGEVNTFRAAYTCTTVYLVQIFFYQRFYFSVIYTKKWYTHWQVCLCGCFRRAVILVFVILFYCMNLCLMVNVILIDWRCCFRLYFVKPSSANTVMLYNDNEWTFTYQWLFIPNQMIWIKIKGMYKWTQNVVFGVFNVYVKRWYYGPLYSIRGDLNS